MSSIRYKKSFTSLDTAVIARELNASVSGSRIDNVYRSSSSMLLKIKGGEIGSGYLLIEPARRMHLTRRIGAKDSRGWVPTFRAFIRNAVIESVEQIRFERIVRVGLRSKGSELFMYVELIPRGIVSVTSQDSKVLAVTSPIRAKDRDVFPGAKYSLPPPLPDVLSESVDILVNMILKSGKSLGSALVRELGIPPEVVNEIVNEDLRARKVNEINIEKIAEIIGEIKKFMISVIKSPTPVIVKVSGRPVGFHPFIPRNLYDDKAEYVKYTSFSDAVDDYFSEVLAERVINEDEVAKHEALLRDALGRLDEISKSINALEKVARIFSENYYVIEQLWRCVRNVVKKAGWDKVSKICKVTNVEPSKGIFKIVFDDIELSLNIIEPVHKQYAMLMKRLEKEKDRLERGKKAVEELRKRLEEVKERASIRRLRRVVEWYDSFHWLITSNGFLAIGGRDAQQNEKVVRKYLGPRDIFVHADVHGASAFVILTEGKEVSEKDIREVAVMAASYSRAWLSGFASVDVFWVYGDQVSKSPPPGQYLPKGSFMVYGKKNYIRGVRLRLGIGIEIISDDAYRLIAGPDELVAERAAVYAVIEPGNIKRGKIAERITDIFKKAVPGLTDLRADSIVGKVPGPSRIVGTGGRDVGRG